MWINVPKAPVPVSCGLALHFAMHWHHQGSNFVKAELFRFPILHQGGDDDVCIHASVMSYLVLHAAVMMAALI